MQRKRTALGCGALLGAALILGSASAGDDAAANRAFGELEWQEMIPGVEFANVKGDWAKGAHGKMVRFQPGTFVPMHIHSGAYDGVMIAGRLTNPYPGENAPWEMGPGDFWSVAAEAPHENRCVSDEPCIFFTASGDAWDAELLEP
jgi:quercetin dioxygenase-like cupin family protein